MTQPSLDSQRSFWDGWNQQWRFRNELDVFMERQRQVAVRVAEKKGLRNARILDVGCGTGWLGNSLTSFGRVTGTDLSPRSIEEGKRRHPNMELICSDFLALDLPSHFDLVISADSLAHMHDQRAFIERVCALLVPGGTFLLMTQNPPIWERRSLRKPLGEGQIQIWPSLAEIRKLLTPNFRIEKISSLVPGGDQGILFWVENRWVRGGMGRLIGRRRWEALLEALRLGRELVIVARRLGS